MNGMKCLNKDFKIKFFIFLIIVSFLMFIFFFNNYSYKNDSKFKLFINEIQKVYDSFNKVNINDIDYKIYGKKFANKYIDSTINIGLTLDKKYVLETMITLTSIMATQKKTTKIRFHLGVTNDFSADLMAKIYGLKYKINNLVEINFYYLKSSMERMKNFHPTKGIASPGRFELPILVPDNVERLLIFDVGDVLVLRDLTNLYNYNMNNYVVLGPPEPVIIESFMKPKYNITKYINIGSILVDVKKIKEMNFWDSYTKNRNIELIGAPDQTLFNIIMPDEKKNYLPFKFGGFNLFMDDKSYDSKIFVNYHYKNWINNSLSDTLPDNPKNETKILNEFFNPIFIHQFDHKWKYGYGISIYRIINKYFISLTGFQKEICKKFPGYCI